MYNLGGKILIDDPPTSSHGVEKRKFVDTKMGDGPVYRIGFDWFDFPFMTVCAAGFVLAYVRDGESLVWSCS